MIHTWEYRLYRSLWILIPLLVILFALTIRAFQPPALVRIETEEAQEDFVFLTNEEITLSFQTLELGRQDLTTQWYFGDSISSKIFFIPDSAEPEKSASLRFLEGPGDSLGLPMEVVYEELPPKEIEGWTKQNQSNDSTVVVRFPHPGRYRLKLEVLDTSTGISAEHSREIEVFRAIPPSRYDTTLKIIGPTEGLVEEELVFFTTGESIDSWHWDFGDKKFLFEDKEQVLYSYADEGVYTIKCRISNSDQVLKHKVTIRPTWNADSLPSIEIDTSQLAIDNLLMDIKRHLQAISDANADQTKEFYWHKDYIDKRYIAADHKPIMVVVNDEGEPIDYNSYCQRIHVLEGSVSIDEVAVEWATLPGGRIRALLIKQTKNSE